MNTLQSVGLGFAALVESLPFDVWLRDAEDRLVYANPTARSHWDARLGLRPDEARMDPETLALWEENNRRALSGELVVGEVAYEHGRYFNVIAPLRLGGEIVGAAGINVDVEKLRDVDARLESGDTLLGLITDALPVAFGIRRVHENRIFYEMDNRYVRDLFGRTAQELRGRCARELGIDAVTCERALERFAEAKRLGTAVDLELELVSSRGVRMLEGAVMPIDSPPSAKPGDYFALVAQDVTEERRVQRHLVHADRLSSLETLVAAIGHEISNPLTYVMANVAYVRDVFDARSGTSPDETRAALDAALEGLSQVSDLIKDLRAFAQGREEDVGTVRIVEVIESVAGLVRRELGRRATLKLELRAVPPIRGTGVKLAQIILNLIKNALEAFSDTSDVEHNRIEIETRRVGDRVEIEVRDNGPGVPPELEPRLFQPFTSSKSRGGGSGLGLYVSREVLRSLGGNIEHVRPPEGGAAFIVSLPVARPR